MNRFSVIFAGDTPMRQAWNDAGFVCFKADRQDDVKPDALVWMEADAASLPVAIIADKPKVFVITARYVPVDLPEYYSLHFWQTGGQWITVGTMLESELTEPKWPAYGDDWQKAVADTVFRYLLQDVFRETAEWCGHMSSVVRPF